MNTHSLLLSHSVQTGPGRFVPNWQPKRAICRHFRTGVQGGGDFNRNYELQNVIHSNASDQPLSLFCNTEFGFTYQRRGPGLPVSDFRLDFEKSAPHRAISTEQYQHRNNQTEGSAHYSPPRAPFFASRPFSRILAGSWSAMLRVLASGVGHADPPCYYGGSI